MSVLKSVVLSAALIIGASAVHAESHEKDVFRNQTLGIELPKPDGWRYVSAAEAYEEAQIMEEMGYKGAIASFQIPLVSMLKVGERPDELTPSLKVYALPYGPGCSIGCFDHARVLAAVLKAHRDSAHAFELVTEPVEVMVSGASASYGSYKHAMMSASGEMLDVQASVWVIPSDHYFLLAAGAATAASKAGTVADVERIVSAIKIRRAEDVQ